MFGGPDPGIGCCCRGFAPDPSPSSAASSHSADKSPELNLKGDVWDLGVEMRLMGGKYR